MSGQGKNWRKRKRKKNIFLNNEIVLMLNWENYSQGQWSNGTNLEAAAKEKVLKSFSCKGTYVTHVRQTLSGLI